MKQGTKVIIIALSLAAILILAVFAYKKLSPGLESPNTPLPFNTETIAQKNTDFTVTDVDGKAVRLSDFKGKPVVLNFWASWCGPCCSELPGFDAIYKEYGDRVHFLMVNLTDGRRETISGVKAFIADNAYTFPVYFDTDSEASDAFGVYSIPMTVFFTADGEKYDSRTGVIEEESLKAVIDNLLGGTK